MKGARFCGILFLHEKDASCKTEKRGNITSDKDCNNNKEGCLVSMFDKLLKMVNNMDADQSYREKALRAAPSNNGWYRCRKCGKSFRASDMDADHIIPQSRGGGDEKANLQYNVDILKVE